VGILRKLSKMKGNLFTTKLYDVIIGQKDHTIQQQQQGENDKFDNSSIE
jgi:serine/threonine protein kinase